MKNQVVDFSCDRQEGVARMEQALAAGRRIAWLSLAASAVAFMAAVCAIVVHVIH